MKVAINYFGDMIIKDETGHIQIYKNTEMEIIRTALYKWTQKKEPVQYEDHVTYDRS